jgi:hypothetical protein
LKSAGFIFAVLLSTFSANAQTIHEYGSMITLMNASPDINIRNKAVHLDSLMYKVQPKLYLENLVQTVFGQTDPVCLQTDVKSVSMLNQFEPLFNKVELITVRINGLHDFDFLIDQAQLIGFTHLKYVHFLCSFPCDPESLKPLFIRNNAGITVFYSISIPN